MSMVGTAATRRGLAALPHPVGGAGGIAGSQRAVCRGRRVGPHRRSRRLAVSTERFERIGAQLDLDATQRAAFDRLLAELRGRGDKVQQQVAPLYRAAWDAAGNPTAGRGRGVSAVRRGVRQAARSSTARRRAQTLDFLATLSPEQRGRFVALARERRQLAEVAHIPAPPERNHFVPKSRSPASPSPGRI